MKIVFVNFIILIIFNILALLIGEPFLGLLIPLIPLMFLINLLTSLYYFIINNSETGGHFILAAVMCVFVGYTLCYGVWELREHTLFDRPSEQYMEDSLSQKADTNIGYGDSTQTGR